MVALFFALPTFLPTRFGWLHLDHCLCPGFIFFFGRRYHGAWSACAMNYLQFIKSFFHTPSITGRCIGREIALYTLLSDEPLSVGLVFILYVSYGCTAALHQLLPSGQRVRALPDENYIKPVKEHGHGLYPPLDFHK